MFIRPLNEERLRLKSGRATIHKEERKLDVFSGAAKKRANADEAPALASLV